jgi:hypothetical protein
MTHTLSAGVGALQGLDDGLWKKVILLLDAMNTTIHTRSIHAFHTHTLNSNLIYPDNIDTTSSRAADSHIGLE